MRNCQFNCFLRCGDHVSAFQHQGRNKSSWRGEDAGLWHWIRRPEPPHPPPRVPSKLLRASLDQELGAEAGRAICVGEGRVSRLQETMGK